MSLLSVLLVVEIAVCLVLAFSGVMKLRDAVGSRSAVAAFGLPAWAVAPVATLLPYVELGLAVGILVLPGWFHLAASWAAVALFATFTVAVVRLLRAGRAPDCHCFGELSAEPIGTATVVRNVLLTGAALVIALSLARPSWPGTAAALTVLPRHERIGFLLLLTTVVAPAGLWIVRKRRLPGLRERSGQRAESDGNGPGTELTTSAGLRIGVNDLAADGDRVFVFLKPGCSFCVATVDALPAWRSQLPGRMTLQTVSIGTAEDTADGYPSLAAGMLYDGGKTYYDELGLRGCPAAVVVGSGGTVMHGPAHGTVAIARLLDEVREYVTSV